MYFTVLATEAEGDVTRVALPETSAIGKRVVTERTPVQLTAELGKERSIVASASGTLTRLNIKEGSRITQGEVLFAVDGVDVVAYRSSTPLFRPLRKGDVGEDVRGYQELLVALGLLEGADEHFGPRVESATKELQKRLHAKPDGVFRTDYVTFVPLRAGSVTAVESSVGDRVEFGTPLAALSSSMKDLQFRATEPGQSLAPLHGAPVKLEAGTAQIVLENPTSMTPGTQQKLLGFLADAQRDGSYPRSAVVTENGLVTYGQLFMELADPQTYAAVPAGALISTPAGKNCLVVDEKVLRVEATPSTERGVVFVDPAFIGRHVANQPGDKAAQKCK